MNLTGAWVAGSSVVGTGKSERLSLRRPGWQMPASKPCAKARENMKIKIDLQIALAINLCYLVVMVNKPTSDSAMLEAIKSALNGGRTYGTSQHRVAIKNLAMRISAASEEDLDAYIDAIVKISNISALQQKLAKAGVIDRETREQVKANLFDALKA